MIGIFQKISKRDVSLEIDECLAHKFGMGNII